MTFFFFQQLFPLAWKQNITPKSDAYLRFQQHYTTNFADSFVYLRLAYDALWDKMACEQFGVARARARERSREKVNSRLITRVASLLNSAFAAARRTIADSSSTETLYCLNSEWRKP